VLELGYAYLSALTLPEVAQPHMESLVAEVNESSSIAVLDDLDIVYVARVPTQRIMTITIAVGTRLPAYATSMGRVLLAGLEDGALEARLERMELERFTPTTPTSVDDLRGRIDVARDAGWAMVDQELEQGVRSAAVPIRDATGLVVAALNVSVHATRMTMPALRKEVVSRLLRTAAAIEVDLSVSGSVAGSATP
jgi:IclR family pca regulon transcriptional regulator